MAKKHKKTSALGDVQLDEWGLLALMPVVVGIVVYGLFRVLEALTGAEVEQGVAIAAFTTVLTSLIATATIEAARRREEKERWEQQRALLNQLSDWLRTNTLPPGPTRKG